MPRRLFTIVLGLTSLAYALRPLPSPAAAANASQAAATPTSPIAVPAYRQANRVAVLKIEGVIDRFTLASLERRVRRAVKDGADAVVLDIKTPGGELFATLEICHLIRTECPANTVAWVNPQAYSAGTIIALACREIIVAPNSTFGDAAPILFSPLTGLQPLPPTERAKMEGPFITEIIDAARRNHYDEKLVQAFVRLGDGVWMLENIQTGEHVFVDLAEYRAVFGEDPPLFAGAGSPPASLSSNRQTVRPYTTGVPSNGPASQPSGSAAATEAQFQQSLPPTRQPLTVADRGQWKLLRQVVDDSTLLTVKPDEALYYGLATQIVASDSELQAYFGAREMVRYDSTWSEGLVRFLCSFWVRAILIIIFLVALFIELAAPGMGVFGATAGIALLILIGAPLLGGLAKWWDIVLIVGGLGLVAAELFLIPGTGIAGIAGVLCLLIGLVGTFVSGDIGTAQGQSELWTGLLTTLMSVFIAGIALWFVSKHIHSMPLLNRIVLSAELPSVSDSAPTGLLEAMGVESRTIRPGDTGTAETDLRPAGRANVNGRLLDVKSAGGYIDKGSPIRVVSVGRFVIEVEELT